MSLLCGSLSPFLSPNSHPPASSLPLLHVPLCLFPSVFFPPSLLLCISPLSLPYISSLCFFLFISPFCLFLSICSLLSLSLRLSYVSPPMPLLSVFSRPSLPLCLFPPSLLSVFSSLNCSLCLFPSVSFFQFILHLSPLSVPLCPFLSD
jgi:hypothetical protein